MTLCDLLPINLPAVSAVINLDEAELEFSDSSYK